MSKPKAGPIVEADLSRFVQECSDFDFEMRVLAHLRGLGFTCSHAGAYQDPITNKIRQFDIRAERTDGRCRLALAVECKNVRDSSPILLSAVPRTGPEAFHHVLHSPQNALHTRVREMAGQESPYKPGAIVGKKTDQVRKDFSGILSSDDQATFEKMNQAVSSCYDLVQKHGSVTSTFLVAIVPVLVLPTNRLWQVEYDEQGVLKKDPFRLSHSTLFLDHTWSIGNPGVWSLNYRVSHIDCVTIDAIQGWVETRFGVGGLFPTTGS